MARWGRRTHRPGLVKHLVDELRERFSEAELKAKMLELLRTDEEFRLAVAGLLGLDEALRAIRALQEQVAWLRGDLRSLLAQMAKNTETIRFLQEQVARNTAAIRALQERALF